MERSPVKDIEIKHILKAVLTDEIHSREVYRKGIDHSYYYEGYTAFQAGELSSPILVPFRLLLPDMGVFPACSQQFLMPAAFYHTPAFHDQDLVCHAADAYPVGDNDGSPAADHLREF